MSEPEFSENFNDISCLSFDEVVINLKIISKIRIGDKLTIHGNLFNIQTSGIYRFLSQIGIFAGWKSGVNTRYHSLLFLNENYDYVFRTIDEYISTNIHNPKLNRLINEMVKSSEGLQNLKTTYHGDIATQARIDYLLDQIDLKSQLCYQSQLRLGS
jgi:hypothetical protein